MVLHVLGISKVKQITSDRDPNMHTLALVPGPNWADPLGPTEPIPAQGKTENERTNWADPLASWSPLASDGDALLEP